jgi:nicotinamide mononucleotide transporter
MLEWAAMLLSLAYILLAAKGSLWCWPAAFISTALYTYIFYDFLLLMDSALNAYYLAMAVYGYWSWRKNTVTAENNIVSNNETYLKQSDSLTVISWQANWHIKVCIILAAISAILGYVMDNFTPADFPYLDTLTTVYAVFATYLVTQKVLENWLYWVVIDLASIYLYIEKGLYPTALLFMIFVGIAIYGFLKWRVMFDANQHNNQSDNSFA